MRTRGDYGELQKLDNYQFAESSRILQTGPCKLAKFSTENDITTSDTCSSFCQLLLCIFDELIDESIASHYSWSHPSHIYILLTVHLTLV